jgi:hypothetical protein
MFYGGIVAVIATILYLSRSKPTVAANVSYPVTDYQGNVESPIPDYLTYNVPKVTSLAGWVPPSASALSQQTSAASSVPVATTSGTCINCNDMDSNGSLAYSLQSTIAGLVNSVNNFSEQYASSLESAFPNQYSQYINNPTGASLSSQYSDELGNGVGQMI